MLTTCQMLSVVAGGQEALEVYQTGHAGYNMNKSTLAQIASLMLLVGFLGEQSQFNGWPTDVLDELKRLALQGYVIVQVAGDVVRIGWPYTSMEEVANVIAQS